MSRMRFYISAIEQIMITRPRFWNFRVMSRMRFYISIGTNYYSNIVLEFRVMPRIWFLNSSSAVLVYGLKYSGLGYGSILEYTLTPILILWTLPVYSIFLCFSYVDTKFNILNFDVHITEVTSHFGTENHCPHTRGVHCPH